MASELMASPGQRPDREDLPLERERGDARERGVPSGSRCGETEPGAERVALRELPESRDQLPDAAVRERQTEHDRFDRRRDDPGVDQAEHERGERECGEPERRRVRQVCTWERWGCCDTGA